MNTLPAIDKAEPPGANRPRAGLRRNVTLALRHLLAICLAALIVFEEWGWEPLSRLIGTLARLTVWARVEQRIAALSPPASLAVLTLPWFFLLPLKLVTLWLLATEQFALAMAAVLFGKIIGTAIVARLFSLTKPALLRMAWFASWYRRWTHAKSRLLRQARATGTWIRMARLKDRWTRRARDRRARRQRQPNAVVRLRRLHQAAAKDSRRRANRAWARHTAQPIPRPNRPPG